MLGHSHLSIHPPSYNIILSEHENHAIPLLQYRAAVICLDHEGTRIVLQGKKEATIWAAYRDLMRITMKEVSKQLSLGNVRTSSCFSSASASRSGSSHEEGIIRIGLRQAKSSRVLGLDDAC